VKEQKKDTWFYINMTNVPYRYLSSIYTGVWVYLTVDVVSEVVHPVAHPLAVPALHQLIRRYVHLMSNSDPNYGMQISAVQASVPDPDLYVFWASRIR
jgi:hypothetical protein